MDETLKPCPLCGGEAVIQRFGAHPSLPFRIICSCGAEIRGGKGESVADAVERWNRRAERTCRVVRSGEPSPTGVPRKRCCSECGGMLTRFGAYCPSCGARIIKEDS